MSLLDYLSRFRKRRFAGRVLAAPHKLACLVCVARFASVSGAGHYGYLEQPDAFAEQIETFLG